MQQARSVVPSALEPLPAFWVDGTWNVPITLTFVGRVLLESCPLPFGFSKGRAGRLRSVHKKTRSVTAGSLIAFSWCQHNLSNINPAVAKHPI